MNHDIAHYDLLRMLQPYRTTKRYRRTIVRLGPTYSDEKQEPKEVVPQPETQHKKFNPARYSLEDFEREYARVNAEAVTQDISGNDKVVGEALHQLRQTLGRDYQAGQLQDTLHATRTPQVEQELDWAEKLHDLTEKLRSELDERVSPEQQGALAQQVGGSHYKDLAIQPVEYCQRNGLGFCESSVVKYVTRWRSKGNGVEDLKKAKHFIDLLIEMEEFAS